MAVTGIVLAAGAGSRAGGPKALRGNAEEPWLAHAANTLLDGGCDRVVVVLGARADLALALVPEDDRVATVIADDWAEGMSHSLRVGLRAANGDALISLVDLPGLPASVVRRVLAADGELRQAVFAGRPGHPVFIAAAHVPQAIASLQGDHGARPYLVEHGVNEVECSDLWDGTDVDAPLR